MIDLTEDLGLLSKDPLRFVLWAFPWGEEGTELATAKGPEPWQVALLSDVRDGLRTANEAIQEAVASGHGVGKSALVSWLTLWAFSTFPGTRGVITANTENQLKTKTWVELNKWFRLFIARDLFKISATRLAATGEMEEEWRIDQVPWSERTVESFAGLHNKGKRILVIFDEASAIPDNIWETTEGALTDENTEILWFVFGNPTRNTGRFRECFEGGKHHSSWKCHRVDSRQVSITNKDQIRKWINAYGDDSDFVRVRVKGEFPRVGAMEFIPRALAEEAATRADAYVHKYDPLVIGVDVARFGDDETVIAIRKGRDARGYPAVRLRGADTMQVAGKVAELVKHYRADSVFVDGGGVGGGVIDRLRQLRVAVIEVQFGAKADNLNADEPGVSYANKRAEIWGALRSWLRGGMIPEDKELIEQISGVMYAFNANNAIQLERKEDMKKRGLASPDWADALAVTFAYPVMANLNAGSDWPGQADRPAFASMDYDPLEVA